MIAARVSASVLSRAGWAVADQALSSLTNFVLALAVARSVTPREFGAFGLIFAVYTVVLGGARALTTEPLAIRYTQSDDAKRRSALGAVAGSAVVMGVAAGLVCALVGVAAGGSVGRGLVALGITLPGLLLQDCWRLSFFVERRGAHAVLNDAIWAVGLGGLLFLVPDDPAATDFLLAWGGGAGAAAVIGGLQAHIVPRLGKVLSWWRAHSDLAPNFFGEFAAMTASAHLAIFSVSVVAGLAGAGALRGGQVLMGPLNVIFMGAALIAVPEAVRWRQSSSAKLVRGCLGISFALALSALIWGAAALAVPDRAGRAVLGATWGLAEPTVLPLTIWMAASGVVAGLALGLRVLDRARRSFVLRAITGTLCVVAAGVGAALDGARGAAWGLAAVTTAAVAWWWVAFAGARDAAGPAETVVDAAGISASAAARTDQAILE